MPELTFFAMLPMWQAGGSVEGKLVTSKLQRSFEVPDIYRSLRDSMGSMAM